MQSDDALFRFADAHQKDAGQTGRSIDIAIGKVWNPGTDGAINGQLVGRHERHSAPRYKRRTEHLYRRRRDTASSAFTPEGRDRARMSQKESRLLPNVSEQIVQIVGGRRPRPGAETHRRSCGMQQALLWIVQNLRLLTLLDSLNRQ